ncbi:hypothetical protein JL720_7543 [Aureococcus anophagefferens]|uniref:Uncharacterized protein n=1 Tax=Aureococcus anophagefferens TaxID=44056 RepID=F0Y576_AURAN|nr:hypothetical protein AURANDRAFT_63047 [Aureococcus anophagefferens]EGB09449.1 hypothetical protein AURANDRAFT_63047 [Aureococcus anophagefferens]KAH8085556.1 hypothetical protein JL720_7543 [Aureococcus anophagefferens]|eukprot:XP_009035516.1 hypothetical protein AURANDRAFT_63047 [Aureococcus anophagefferens]
MMDVLRLVWWLLRSVLYTVAYTLLCIAFVLGGAALVHFGAKWTDSLADAAARKRWKRRLDEAARELAPYIDDAKTRAKVLKKAFAVPKLVDHYAVPSTFEEAPPVIYPRVLRGALRYLVSLGHSRAVVGEMVVRAPAILRMKARPNPVVDPLRERGPAAVSRVLGRLKGTMPGSTRRGELLRRAVAKDARLLVRYEFDCWGACQGRCGSCWRHAHVPVDVDDW